MKKSIQLIAVSIMTLALQQTAYATAYSSASIKNIEIYLIDTNLSDGISPYITFNNGALEAGAGLIDFGRGFGGGLTNYYPQVFGGAAHSVYFENNWNADASVTIQSMPKLSNQYNLIHGSIGASGTVAGTINPGWIGEQTRNSANYNSYANWTGGFSISANTLMLISGTASTFASAASQEIASASACINLYSANQTPPNCLYSTLDTENQQSSSGINQKSSINSGRLVASLFNNSSNTEDGRIYLSVGTSGTSTAAVVPEPETYTMMLTGLIAVGLGARRGRGIGKLSGSRLSDSASELD